MSHSFRSTAAAYGIAVGVTAVAAAVRWALNPVLGVHVPYLTFFVAIVAAGWRGGWGPAAVAAALGLLISLDLFVPPYLKPEAAPGPFLVSAELYFIASTMIVLMVAEMHRARARTRQQEELLRTTLTSIGDAVLTTDAAGDISFLNPVAEQLTGWTRAAAAGRPLREVMHIVNERTRAPVESPVAKVLSEGKVVGLANHSVLIGSDGTERPIDDSAAPILGPDGEVAGVVMVFRDISARREAEQERQVAQDSVIATLESIPDAFVRVDKQWRIQYANNQYERHLGRPREQLLGKLLWDEWPELGASAAETQLRRAMGAREMAQFEHRFAQAGRWFAIKACPVDSEDLVIFSQEITGRRQAEEALRQSEQRFRLATEAISGIVYDYDPASGHVERSQGLYEVTGYRPEEVPPTAEWWWQQIHPDDLRELDACRAIPGGLVLGRGLHVYRVRHKDGHYVYLSDRSLTVSDEHGRLLRQVGCSIDISALKEAENHLKDADRRKDQFLATLAHELRNPLAPISNAVQFLKARNKDPSLAWGLGVIERQTQTMARLLDDLLDVSRISRNKLVLRRQAVDLAEVLQRAIETSQPQIDMGGHELSVSLPPEPIRLDADPVRLAQVFSNLLTNAAKYTAGGGHIRLAVARENGEVAVSVRDDGIGIAPELLPRLFEIFMQAESALDRAQGGLGIGLSLVRGLVELHGGHIEARSEGMGHGSEFIVRLPLPDRIAADKTTDTPARASAQECRILIADDNVDSADTLATALKTFGHDVCVAYDGSRALALAEERRPEVVLLDIGMPKMNGYEVCRAIRATAWGRDTTLIALTGWGQDEDRRSAQDAGFDYHMVKPVDFEALSGMLATAQHKLAD